MQTCGTRCNLWDLTRAAGLQPKQEAELKQKQTVAAIEQLQTSLREKRGCEERVQSYIRAVWGGSNSVKQMLYLSSFMCVFCCPFEVVVAVVVVGWVVSRFQFIIFIWNINKSWPVFRHYGLLPVLAHDGNNSQWQAMWGHRLRLWRFMIKFNKVEL